MVDGKVLIEKLLVYAKNNLHLEERDEIYFRNLLLREFKLDEPTSEVLDLSYVAKLDVPDTLVKEVEEYAIENGLVEECKENLYSTYIFGLLSPLPSVVNKTFYELKEKEGVEKAAQHGGQGITGEIGITAAIEEKADGILRHGEHHRHHRAADQRTQSTGEEGDVEAQTLPQGDLKATEDQTGGDHQRGEQQLAQILHLRCGGAPVAPGKGRGIQFHRKNLLVSFRQSEHSDQPHNKEGTPLTPVMRQRDAGSVL